jgi:hypothetical protein
VQRIALKAAIAAATTAATAAAAVMKSTRGRKGQTQKTAAKRAVWTKQNEDERDRAKEKTLDRQLMRPQRSVDT